MGLLSLPNRSTDISRRHEVTPRTVRVTVTIVI